MREFLFLVTVILLSACNKEDHNNPLISEPEPKPETFSVQWDNLIDHSTENSTDIFIGTQYIGVQNWPLIAHAPYIFVGATFPKNAFATSFDREFKGNKHPINLTFNFKHPANYITCMETISGIEYKKKIKEAMKSEEYKSYTTKVTSPKSAKIIPAKDAIDSAFNNEFSSKSGYEDIKDRENAHELTMEELKKIAEEKGTGEAYETYRKSSPTDPIGYNHDTLEDEFSPFEDKSQVESVMSDFFRVITRKLKSGTTAKPNMFASLSSKDYMNNIKKRSLDRIHAKKTVNDSKSSEDADLFSM